MDDKCRKPDPEQFEREQRDLFQYADITDTSKHSGIRYGTLSKGLNPNDPTPSIATEFLMFLYGCRLTRPDLEEKVWGLVCRARRGMLPREDEGGDLGEAMAACGDFIAVAARSEDGQRTPEEVEAARQDVLTTVEKLSVYAPANHMINAG